MQTVRLQDLRIVDKCDKPRSYIVQTPNGSRLRRNQRFLKDLVTPRSLDQTPATPQPASPRSKESEQPPQIPEIDSCISQANEGQEHCSNVTTPFANRDSRPKLVIKKPERLIEKM